MEEKREEEREEGLKPHGHGKGLLEIHTRHTFHTRPTAMNG
jgi:hypothetical protein